MGRKPNKSPAQPGSWGTLAGEYTPVSPNGVRELGVHVPIAISHLDISGSVHVQAYTSVAGGWSMKSPGAGWASGTKHCSLGRRPKDDSPCPFRLPWRSATCGALSWSPAWFTH
jgi:hypothetical protein